MNRDAFGLGEDTSCWRCGSPCGTPCGDCGYLMQRDTPTLPRVPLATPEYRPLTKAEKANIDADNRAAIDRAEWRQRHS